MREHRLDLLEIAHLAWNIFYKRNQLYSHLDKLQNLLYYNFPLGETMAVFKKPCSLSIMSNEGTFPRPLP